MRIFMYLYTQIRLLIMYKDNIEHTTSIKTAEGYHVPVLLGICILVKAVEMSVGGES